MGLAKVYHLIKKKSRSPILVELHVLVFRAKYQTWSQAVNSISIRPRHTPHFSLHIYTHLFTLVSLPPFYFAVHFITFLSSLTISLSVSVSVSIGAFVLLS
jgi:hypothetical protein